MRRLLDSAGTPGHRRRLPSLAGPPSSAGGGRWRERRVALGAVVLGLTGALAFPGTAAAHGIGSRADLPIPAWLFVWTASAVLVVSFVTLGALWKTPQLQGMHPKAFPAWASRALTGRPLEVLLGAASVFLLGVVLWSGFAGRQSATNNVSPTFVYITFWLGLVPASAILGNVYSAVNPWRSIGRAVGWTVRPLLGKQPDAVPYPEWLGIVPAAAGLFGFAWLENVAVDGQLPRNVAAAALVYTCFTLIGMAVFGVERWTRRGEAFAVYFGLIARIAPFGRRGDEIVLRRPLSGLADLKPRPGTILLLSVMIGTVSFDGFAEGPVWVEIAPRLEDALDGALGATGARLLADSLGIVALVAVIYAFFRLGALTVRATAQGLRRVRRRVPKFAVLFVHSLVPIAVAYVGAHFISLFLLEGQGIASLVSDPLGRGWDLFGSRGSGINFGLITATNIWYLQVARVVAGHVS
ncbi:MAG: fenitrothion hydrolase, partial [Gaiellales bacterium]